MNFHVVRILWFRTFYINISLSCLIHDEKYLKSWSPLSIHVDPKGLAYLTKILDYKVKNEKMRKYVWKNILSLGNTKHSSNKDTGIFPDDPSQLGTILKFFFFQNTKKI